MRYKISDVCSAYNAKTHLSQLLQEVERGRSVTITLRGRPVAKLIPFTRPAKEMTRKEATRELAKIRARVKGKVDIRAAIREGRKYE